MLAFQSVMAGSTSGAGPPELPRHLAARIVVQAKDMEDKQRTAALFATEDHLLAFYRTSDKAAVCKVARIDKSTFQFGPALALVQLLEAAGGLAADAEPSTLTVLSNALHLMLEAAAAVRRGDPKGAFALPSPDSPSIAPGASFLVCACNWCVPAQPTCR